MGKPLSRPGCLRQSPCCSKKNEREGYNEDGYIPQRSIYDTMCINEHIDHGSAHSTLGSRRGRETDFSSNGSLGGDMFDTRSSVLLTSGRKLDERFIFDSLKLANDELRAPGGFVRSTSPSVSCSSAPGGSMNKRHPLQDSGKKDNLCRHSWKVLTPPKFPDPLELSPGEKNYLNPGVAFFPNSMTSPQISPFSGSPFSTGTHTPSVFFSPSPLPYHQQFHRQSLPTQPSSPRPPLSELSVSALMCDQDMQVGQEQEQRPDGNTVRLFETFKPKPVESISEQPPPLTPEPENDTAPLLQTQKPKGPTICTTSMESTWPRRLIGRRRTVRQGGAVHNLPILPPLPSLLIRSVSDKKPMPRLSPFPEHQAKVEGKLGKSNLKSELKDCSLQDWKILRQMEEKKAESSKNEVVEVDIVEFGSKMPPVQEKPEETSEENFPNPECEVEVENENWEAVLEMVNSLWDEAWKDSDSQNLGSLRRWPLLHPPSGFGGSQAPSGTSSELGAEDLLELERLSREESIDSELDDIIRSQSDLHLKGNSVVITQPTGQILTKTKAPKVPSLLDLDTEIQLGGKYGLTGSPDSNLTLDSDSSGVYMSNPSQTSKEDITSDGDRSMFELDIGSVSSLSTSKGVNEQGTERAMGTCTVQISNSRQSTVLKTDGEELSRERSIKEIKAKVTVIHEGSRSVNKGSVHHEICNTVNTSTTSTTDVPLPLSPSKHEVKKGPLLDPGDMDPFVATDSFVYLAVSVMPPPAQEVVPTPAAPEEPAPPTAIAKPCPYPDECDFLSTDSFVYLAAPDCHLLGTDCHSVYEDSNDSEDSGSRADFVIASTVGDSDWDSDLTDSEAEPGANKPAWDHWEELEQDVLQGLFCEDQSESDAECHDNLAQQISGRRGELAAIVVPERAEVCSQHTQGGGLHSKVKTVS